jgi:hypothetical protein
MCQQNFDWTQREVSFGVWGEQKCMGVLRVIPLGCELGEQREDPDLPRYVAYGIYIQVKLETPGVNCTGGDFVDPNQFRRLLALLKGTLSSSDTASLLGDDGGVEVHWQRAQGKHLGNRAHAPPLTTR